MEANSTLTLTLTLTLTKQDKLQIEYNESLRKRRDILLGSHLGRFTLAELIKYIENTY